MPSKKPYKGGRSRRRQAPRGPSVAVRQAQAAAKAALLKRVATLEKRVNMLDILLDGFVHEIREMMQAPTNLISEEE